MRFISVLGRKGGVGKTTLSYMLAQGFGRQQTTMLMLTDVRGSVPDPAENAYPFGIFGTRQGYLGPDPVAYEQALNETRDKILSVYDHINNIPNSLIIADGGANREAMDQYLAKLSDMILMPCGYSQEEREVVQRDMLALIDYLGEPEQVAFRAKYKRPFPTLRIVKNRWPGDERRAEALTRNTGIQRFEREMRDLFLATKVTDLPSSHRLLDWESPEVTIPVDTMCSRLANNIAIEFDRADAAFNREMRKTG